MMGKMSERRRKRRQIAKAVKQEVAPKRQGAGDLVVNRTGAGVHSSKKGDKGYKRHPKHKDRDNY